MADISATLLLSHEPPAPCSFRWIEPDHAAASAVSLSGAKQRRHRRDNITDWALDQFSAHYETGNKPKVPITKDAIFHYVYGVLNDPIYREKYALNLKREFPRIPFYADFWRWVEWGEKLTALHIGYEAADGDASTPCWPPPVTTSACSGAGSSGPCGPCG